MRTRSLILVVAMLAAAVAGGQTASAPDAGENFGSDTTFTVFGFRDFLPSSSASGYAGSIGLPAGPTRWASSGSAILEVSANRFPDGVEIDGFDLYFYDNNAGSNFFFNFCRTIRDTASGEDPDTACLVSYQSSGTPGNGYAFVTIPVESDRTIRYRFDWDGDGALETADYYIDVDTPGLDGSVRIASVRARWHRQVSPAPAAASFLDVPTDHPFFQFVEALVDAEITAGCGGGNYCPDSPITRGQMAVFLAVALGLHWPGF